MRIRVRPEADQDLQIGYNFYESQREDLGQYFNDCLISDIESIRLYAGIHAKHHRLHRCMSKRFPFAIYYDLNGDTIEIYAVLDCRQNPAAIDKRLESPPPQQ